MTRKLIVDLSVMTVIGVVLAFIGPFGSSAAPLSARLVSWIGLAWLGYFIYSPLGATVGWLHRKLQLPELGLWVGITLFATVPMTMATWWIGFLSRPPGSFRLPTTQEALAAYLNVLVIGGSITVLFHLIERGKTNPHARNTANAAASVGEPSEGDPVNPPQMIDPPAMSRFMERLAPSLGSELLALEMEDHYVRAHTPLGSELVLMRMRDAVAELDGLDGAQVHRSWWVARGAVADAKRDGRNVRLVLDNGIVAPVSRASLKPLKDAGWF